MDPPIARSSFWDATEWPFSPSTQLYFFSSRTTPDFLCWSINSPGLSSSVEQSKFNPDLITGKTDLPGVQDAFDARLAVDAVAVASADLHPGQGMDI